MRRLLGTISLAVLALTNACSSEMGETDHTSSIEEAPLELTVDDLSSDLSQGMTGDQVRVVQRYLRQFGYLPNADLAERYPAWRPIVDTAPTPGTFDETTTLAVAALQEHLALEQTGIVDAATRERLREHRCGVPEGLPAVDPREKFAHWEGKWEDTTLFWHLGDQGGHDRQDLNIAYRRAMDEWKTHTSVNFLETTGDADIDINFDDIDGRNGTLAQASSPLGGGDLWIDKAETWAFGDTTPSGSFDLQSTVLHELGHALGLDHSSLPGAVMFPTVAPGTQNRSLTRDDEVAISALYDKWQEAGGKGNDVAVGGQGSVWLIGNSTNSNHGVYIWQGAADGWRRDADISGVRIAVSNTGIPWVVRSNGQLFKRRSKFIQTEGWDQVLACAKDVGIGANGDVWIIGCTANANGFEILKYNNGLFNPAPGSATRISVAPDGRPWVVDDDGKIFRRTTNQTGSGSWERMPGSAKDIGAGPEGDVWAIGTTAVGDNFSIHVWNEQAAVGSAPARRQWIRVAGSARTVGVGPFGPWVISAAKDIFQSEK